MGSLSVLDLAQDRPNVSLSASSSVQSKKQLLRDLAWPVAIGCMLRFSIGVCVYQNFLNPDRDHWEFGYEMGRIARSIATGHGFGNPYWADTGPTAILTPVYPYLLAGIFSVFGVFTKASALVMVLVNCTLSALTAVPIFLIARKAFDDATAKFASLVWTFFPYSIYFAVATMWYHAFVGLLLAVIVLLALHLQTRDDLGGWLALGALFGFAALTNPVIAGVAPPVGIWLMHRLAQQKKRWIRAGTSGLLAMMLLVLPWQMRNSSLLHQRIPLKDGFWMEVCVGNVNNTLHWWDAGQHPSGGDEAKSEFARLGEIHYMAAKRQDALGYIKAHPGLYVWRSMRHVVFLWTGFWSFQSDYLRMEPFDPENIVVTTTISILAMFGLRRLFRREHSAHNAALFAIVLVVYPLPYYLSHVDPGFRHPIDPLVILLASSALLRRSGQKSIPDREDDEEVQFALR